MAETGSILLAIDNITINFISKKDLEPIPKNQPETGLKRFLSLFALFIIDIAPIPTTPIITAFIIFNRPAWLIRAIASVYGKDIKNMSAYSFSKLLSKIMYIGQLFLLQSGHR